MSEKYTVEGYWDCRFCGCKGVRGSVRVCPSCGKPRGEETKFYLKEFGEEHAVEGVSDEPDWLCEYCSTYNPATAAICQSCNAPRGNSKTYADIRGSGERESITDIDGNEVDDSGELGDAERERLNQQQEREDKRRKREARQRARAGNQPEAAPRKEFPKKRLAAILAAVVAVFGLIYFFMPRHVDFTVTDMSWSRSISIQERYTSDESDWEVPTGARVYDERRELHHTDRVVDHYEKYTDTVSERVLDHYETKKKKVDKGNGHFDIVTERHPVYKTVKKRVEKERPVYRNVPVFKTKYYFLVERWKNTRSIDTSSHDKKPYFGEVVLKDGVPPYDVGKERENGRTEKYCVTGSVDGEEKTFQIDDVEWWNSISVGDQISGKVDINDTLRKEE